MKKLFIVIIGFIVFGCSQSKRESYLEEIYEIVSDSPEEALEMLDSVNPKDLSKDDSHFYDLLSIKAADKAYIRHTSDSLILDVIKYYGNHKKEGLYPEALYYGGRVYSDLGDLPTSLTHFQQALDNLPEEMKGSDLEDCILSQTGRLLDRLRLYDEAIPYVEKALEIDRQNRDTLGLAYNLLLLSGIYLRSENYPKAEEVLSEIDQYNDNIPVSLKRSASVYMAKVKNKTGHTQEALNLIRPAVTDAKGVSRNTALAFAANIYMTAGIHDTAFIYAKEIVENDNPSQKSVGYDIMLSPELYEYLPSDSVPVYYSDYHKLLEREFDENEREYALIQHSLYNYNKHLQERLESERNNRILTGWILMVSFLLLVAVILVLSVNYRKIKIRMRLQGALKIIEDLQQQNNFISDPERNVSSIEPEKISELRKRLGEEIMSLFESDRNISLPVAILESESYRRLMEQAEQNIFLTENDPLWDELEKLITIISPRFKQNLIILMHGKLKEEDYHTALLVKLQIPPTKMSILLGRAKGTIVSRRENLGKRMFDRKMSTKQVDALIRLI